MVLKMFQEFLTVSLVTRKVRRGKHVTLLRVLFHPAAIGTIIMTSSTRPLFHARLLHAGKKFEV